MPEFQTAAPRLRNHLLHASGGLVWHWRAWRRRAAWAAYTAQLHAWLAAWQPPCDTLVLVGPSAGHTLPRELLARFARVHVLEPDPLARWLLRRRFADMPLSFHMLDMLADERGFSALAQAWPNAAMLFCNVLGQVAPPEPAATRWRAALRGALAAHHWASWHDLVSTGVMPQGFAPIVSNADESLETVLARFWRGGELPLTDHRTFGLANGMARTHLLWPFAPGYWHLVECCAHAPERAA